MVVDMYICMNTCILGGDGLFICSIIIDPHGKGKLIKVRPSKKHILIKPEIIIRYVNHHFPLLTGVLQLVWLHELLQR